MPANNGDRDAQIKSLEYFSQGHGLQANLMKSTDGIRIAVNSGGKQAERLAPIRDNSSLHALTVSEI